jgi:hypothetical protein
MTREKVVIVDGRNRLLLLKNSDRRCSGSLHAACEPNRVIEETIEFETRQETGLEMDKMKSFGEVGIR